MTGQYPRRRETDAVARERIRGIESRRKGNDENIYTPNRSERRRYMFSMPQRVRRLELPGWITFRESVAERLRS